MGVRAEIECFPGAEALAEGGAEGRELSAGEAGEQGVEQFEAEHAQDEIGATDGVRLGEGTIIHGERRWHGGRSIGRVGWVFKEKMT